MKKQSAALLAKRTAALMPEGIPRYVRCYDGGEELADRYTVCFTGAAPVMRGSGCVPHYPYLGMSSNPFYPLGIYQHGSTAEHPCDVVNGWPPAMGRKNHLGKRIPFTELPKDCQTAVLDDYKAYWELEDIKPPKNTTPCVTPHHPILSKDGTWKMAKDISPDEIATINII